MDEFKKALQIQDQLIDLNQAMFCQTNPIPIKYAASIMGLCEPEIRLPLTLPSDDCKKIIEQAVEKLKKLS